MLLMFSFIPFMLQLMESICWFVVSKLGLMTHIKSKKNPINHPIIALPIHPKIHKLGLLILVSFRSGLILSMLIDLDL